MRGVFLVVLAAQAVLVNHTVLIRTGPDEDGAAEVEVAPERHLHHLQDDEEVANVAAEEPRQSEGLGKANHFGMVDGGFDKLENGKTAMEILTDGRAFGNAAQVVGAIEHKVVQLWSNQQFIKILRGSECFKLMQTAHAWPAELEATWATLSKAIAQPSVRPQYSEGLEDAFAEYVRKFTEVTTHASFEEQCTKGTFLNDPVFDQIQRAHNGLAGVINARGRCDTLLTERSQERKAARAKVVSACFTLGNAKGFGCEAYCKGAKEDSDLCDNPALAHASCNMLKAGVADMFDDCSRCTDTSRLWRSPHSSCKKAFAKSDKKLIEYRTCVGDEDNREAIDGEEAPASATEEMLSNIKTQLTRQCGGYFFKRTTCGSIARLELALKQLNDVGSNEEPQLPPAAQDDEDQE